MAAAPLDQEGDDRWWTSLLSVAAFHTSQEERVLSTPLLCPAAENSSSQTAPLTPSTGQAPRQREDLSNSPWGSDAFLVSPQRPGVACDNGFVLVAHEEAGRSNSPRGPTNTNDALDNHGTLFDVVECVGSSQAGPPGTPPPVATDGNGPTPVLARQSTGLPGQPDVLVCTLCGCGLADSTFAGLSQHWRSRTRGHLITPKERNGARQLFEQSQGSVFVHATQWNPPREPMAPIPGVPMVEAYRCSVADCPVRFVLAGRETEQRPKHMAWREHQRVKHGLLEFGDRGRPPVASVMVARADNVDALEDRGEGDEPWGPLLLVQRLFSRQPYHEVSLEPRRPPLPIPPTAAIPAEAAADFGRLFADLEQGQAQENRVQATVIPASGDFTVDAWHRYMEFAKYLHGFEWNRARKVADAPDQDASTLQRWVHTVAKDTVCKCYETTAKAGPWMRQILMQRTRSEESHETWHAYSSRQAAAQHARPLVACVDYWSATHLDPAARRAVPEYVRAPAVEQAWAALLQHGQRILQGDAAEAMGSGGGSDLALDKAEELMLQLILTLLAQQAGADERQELPLLGALLVQGIVPGKSPAFRRAGEFSHTLAGFTKMARSVVCTHLLLASEPNDYAAVIEAHLVRGPNNAMNWIGTTLNEALKMDRKNPNDRNKLTWVPAEEKFLLKEHVVSRNDLVAILHSAIEEARQVLCQGLLFVAEVGELPPVPWERMVDRPADTTPGYSCWTDRANAEALREGQDWLKLRVERTKAAEFVDMRTRTWSDTTLTKFEGARQRFQAASLPLFTWLVGPSIRGQTVASYQWRNTAENPRNLVLDRGNLILTGGSHKNLHRGSSAALHVLPREVADLWGWYLWLVWPFWDTIRRRPGEWAEEPLGRGDELLFQSQRGAALTSGYITDCLLKASRRVVTPGFGLQPGRQLISGFVRKYIPAEALGGGEAYFIDRYERSGRRAAERAAALVAESRNQVAGYVPGADEGEDVEDLPLVDLDGRATQQTPLEVSSLRRFNQMRRTFASRSVLARSLGHTTSMDRLRYANDVNVIPGTDDLAMELWALVSHHWHLVLRLPSALEQERQQSQHVPRQRNPSVKRERGTGRVAASQQVKNTGSSSSSSSDASPQPGASRRGRSGSSKRARRDASWPASDRANAVQPPRPSRRFWRGLLREFVQDASAQFRGLQWPALQCIVGYSGGSVLVVAPTGGGKTALFALPAMLPEAGVTVVVVPLCSLRDQLVDRCRQASIRCALWRGDADDNNYALLTQASMVVVMAEHLEMSRFKQWMRVLCAQRRLDRIVVDEVHMPLITNLAWRPVLRQFETLATYGVPLVLLTATLPPAMEPSLLDLMRVSNVPPRLFRSSTVRPNVAYSVVWVEDKLDPAARHGLWSWPQLAELVKAHRRSTMALHGRHQSKMIVFCENKLGIQELVQHLPNSSAYFHNAPSAAAVLEAFLAASNAILCTTSAASHGLDDPDVDDVINVTIPDDLLQYLQQAGRVARKGQPGTAVLLAGPGVQRAKPKTPEQTALRRTMDRYLQRRPMPDVPALQCRRQVIDAHMDGDDTRTYCRPEVGERLCDVCMHRQLQLTEWTVSGRDSARPYAPDVVEATGPLVRRTPSPPPPYHAREGTATTQAASPTAPTTTQATRQRDTIWSTPVRSDLATPPAGSSISQYSGGYRSRASSAALNSSPAAAQARRNGVSSPQMPPMPQMRPLPQMPPTPQPPPPNMAARDRTTTLTQWLALYTGITVEQWRTPKTRVHLMAEFWQLHCGLHFLRGGEEAEWSHTRQDCSLHGSSLYKNLGQRVAAVNVVYRMPPFSGCFTCKMPQLLCKKQPCSKQWAHLIMDAWVLCTELVPYTKELHNNRLAELGLSSNDEDVLGYFGAKIRVGHGPDRMETSRLIEWLVQLTEYGFTRVGKPRLGGFC
jgi:superfamily II DNA helicase RecQ